MGYRERYERWLTDPYFDEETKAELRSIKDNDNEIKERFYKDLEFGTAGLRGIMGAGTNRMNIYTVRKATQGFAEYILKKGGSSKGVAIAFDSRHRSREFAEEAALCLAANGIKVYIFESLRPTPELSYTIRKLGCTAGINITASHNPREYNGYKAYWEDGAQVTPPNDEGIMAEVGEVKDYSSVKTMSRGEAAAAGLYEVIGSDIDDAYIEEIKKMALHREAVEAVGGELKIAYTPLYGTGNVFVRRVLRESGFKNVYVVKEQELPDGDFPTAPYPNPEADEAMDLVMELAQEKGADIVLATDPDGDRLGVRVRDAQGRYHKLTGNMTGCLLADYEIGQRKALRGLPEGGYMIKTVVSSNMADAVARYYGADLRETLTGFKHICREILESETNGRGEYLFGFEESYGYLIGAYARDKDAVSASMALCEAAAYYKTKGMTLWDAMEEMYERYGYYKDDIQTVTLTGIEGLGKIRGIMRQLRENPPAGMAGYKTLRIRDYLAGTIKDLSSGEVFKTRLPKSDVLYYELTGDAWLCARPSGTEPKVKFYYGVKGSSYNDADLKSSKMGEEVAQMIGKMV